MSEHIGYYKIRELRANSSGIKTLCSKCVGDTVATKCMVEFVGSDFTDEELKTLKCTHCGAKKDDSNGQLQRNENSNSPG